MASIRTTLLALSLLVPSAAFADFTGIWTGKGFAETIKKKWDCQQIELRFLQGEQKFLFRGGLYQCDDLIAEYPYSEFVIDGENLIYNGESVGTIKGNAIHLQYDGGQYNLWLKILDQNQLFFRELWSDRNDFLWIEGKLDLNTKN